MNWFLKLFKKESIESSHHENYESLDKLKSLDYFNKGTDYYFTQQTELALQYFDTAFKLRFTDFYEHDAAKFYLFRGGCLQHLQFHFDAILDFDQSIKHNPTDCNLYYSRSISKGRILDYEGEIADLNKAIEISKEPTHINMLYNENAKRQGFANISEMFKFSLQLAEGNLRDLIMKKEKMEKSVTEESKAFWKKIIDDEKNRRLSQIKKR